MSKKTDTPNDNTEWKVTLGDKSMFLADLPIGVLETVARSSKEAATWSVLLAMPLYHADNAERLLRACAKELHVKLPTRISARYLVSCFELADNTLADSIGKDDEDEPDDPFDGAAS